MHAITTDAQLEQRIPMGATFTLHVDGKLRLCTMICYVRVAGFPLVAHFTYATRRWPSKPTNRRMRAEELIARGPTPTSMPHPTAADLIRAPAVII